jgi:glyoxylase-like metal-dependent hydrolase (beta-lactamase superfamily II)
MIHELQGYIQTIYLVEEGDDLLLLDGCCRSDVEVVCQFIEQQLNKSIADLKLVISTHPHPDHAGGLEGFKRLGIPVAGPQDFNLWYQGVSGLLTYWGEILLTYLVAMNKKRGFKNILFKRTIAFNYILRDGDEIPGFKRWKALECPGHTAVDLTLYNDEEKIAYVADNFVGSEKKIFRPYPLFLPVKYKASLRRYIALGVHDFLLAHHGKINIPKEMIEQLIDTVPDKPRSHRNTWPVIILKLMRSLFKRP